MYNSLVVEDVSMSYHNVTRCHSCILIYQCHNVMTISHMCHVIVS